MRGGVELPQILILLVIVLLIFGAKRLPEIARSLGSSTREFKKGISGEEEQQLPSPRDEHVARRQGDETT
ncbi:MAG: twin-arginine translocase TatA/TatE family subunit [Thermoleophilia bacterium]|nr:twin-arginine translocase TatA/TatE family subunit [Thermoleophilia bacterium]